MSTKYPGYKKCVVDTETTGVDRDKHNVWQIAGSILDNKDNVLESFDFKFQPFSFDHIEESAVEKSNIDEKYLRELPMTNAQGYSAFIEVLERHVNRFDKKDKMQMIAYNAGFDSDFIRKLFADNGDNYFGSWFWHPPICVMQLAASFLIDVRGAIRDFQLSTLCECAGFKWDESKAHDAGYDIDMTLKLYKYLRENTFKLGE